MLIDSLSNVTDDPSKVNILLVDDEPKNLLSLERILAPLNENLVTATSGKEALKQVLQRRHALVLLDIDMPGMDGYEVADLIRQREDSRETPIIFITAYDLGDVGMFRGYEKGAVDYLVKPIRAHMLLSKARIFVELHRKTVALERQKERSRAIVAHAMHAYVGLDEKGMITDWNPAAEWVFGWPRAHAVGARMADLIMPERFRGAFESGMRRYLASLDGPFLNRVVELNAIRKDGTEFPIELTVCPIRLPEGYLFSAFISDISVRKRQEEMLQRSEQQFRAIFESASDIIMTTTADGTITALNPAFEVITGLKASAWIGQRLEPIIHPDDAITYEAICREVLTGVRTEAVIEMRMKSQTKGWVDLEASLKPQVDKSGRVVGIYSIGRNIALRKELQRHAMRAKEELEQVVAERTAELKSKTSLLQQRNEEMEQFAYIASHDLQEPLRMVSSYCQLLGEEYKERVGEEGALYIEYAVDGAKRMKILIDDLLEYSRVGASMDETRVAINLNEVVDEALKNLRKQVEEAGAEVMRQDLPTIIGNRTALVRLFQNLISNGIKYRRSDVPPRIEVSAIEEKGAWKIAVADNGIGIDKEHFDRIFVIFQRLHPRTKYTGTGIGLAICKKIVEAHRGRIWVESTVGKGTTCFFTLEKGNPREEGR